MLKLFLQFSLFSGNRKHLLNHVSQVRTGASSCKTIFCLNPHSFVEAVKNKEFAHALASSDYLIADGIGIQVAYRTLGFERVNRITGSDIFEDLAAASSVTPTVKHFFLGSSDYVLNKIIERISLSAPGVEVVGHYSPSFCEVMPEDEAKKVISLINDCHPDVLWVGMTAPKQELWLAKYKSKLNVPLACAVGAVFDFYAGSTRRPAVFLRKSGLEWLGRFAAEPRRLWRRNVISSPLFLMFLLAAVASQKCSRLMPNRER